MYLRQGCQHPSLPSFYFSLKRIQYKCPVDLPFICLRVNLIFLTCLCIIHLCWMNLIGFNCHLVFFLVSCVLYNVKCTLGTMWNVYWGLLLELLRWLGLWTLSMAPSVCDPHIYCLSLSLLLSLVYSMTKLEGVAPLITNPPRTSSTTLPPQKKT